MEQQEKEVLIIITRLTSSVENLAETMKDFKGAFIKYEERLQRIEKIQNRIVGGLLLLTGISSILAAIIGIIASILKEVS